MDVTTVTGGVELWYWGVSAIILAATLGFASGYFCAHTSDQRAFKRSKRSVLRLFARAESSLASAQQVFQFLQQHSQFALSQDQIHRIQTRQDQLLEMADSLAQKSRDVRAAKAVRGRKPRFRAAKQPDRVQWIDSPVDSRTGLPGQTVFASNLESQLQASADVGLCGGLLLIKIDKPQQLKRRFGDDCAEQFFQVLARLVGDSLGEIGFLCHYTEDTLGVLLASVDLANGRELAESIRDTIRRHRFQYLEDGERREVLVTASFGYTQCSPGESVDAVTGRAFGALARSQGRGRNQLHAYDGSKLVHCAAS